jgi:hypothetical protein
VECAALLTCRVLYDARGHADGDGAGRHVARNDCPRADYGARADVDTVDNNRAATNPSTLVDGDSLCRDTLLDHRPGGIIEKVVDGQELDTGGEQDRVSNPDPSLAPDDAGLANEAIAADPDTSVGETTKIVDVQLGPVHDKGVVADSDSLRACMEVSAVVEVDVAAEPDVCRKTKANIILNKWWPSALEHEAIGERPETDPDDTWDST